MSSEAEWCLLLPRTVPNAEAISSNFRVDRRQSSLVENFCYESCQLNIGSIVI